MSKILQSAINQKAVYHENISKPLSS